MDYNEIKHRFNLLVEQYNKEELYSKFGDMEIDLDIEIREQFNVTEPIHLWEYYCIGDADEINLLAETGYDDVDKLFNDMDEAYLIQLDDKVDEYEQNVMEQFTNECLSEAFADFEDSDNHSEDFGGDIDRFAGSSIGGYIVVDGITYAKIRKPVSVRIYDAFNQRYYAHPLAEPHNNTLDVEEGYQIGYEDFCLWKSENREQWEEL